MPEGQVVDRSPIVNSPFRFPGSPDTGPGLTATVLTRRAYLYDHPRVVTSSIRDDRAVDQALKATWDGIVDFNARTVPGARIDHHERPPGHVDLDAGRRYDAHQGVIHRPLEGASVDDQFRLVVENVGNGVAQMLAVRVAALAHDVPEQNAALSGVAHVFHRGRKRTERPGKVAVAGSGFTA